MSWAETLAPIIRKLDVAAKFGGTASWNATGSAALASLLRKMVSIIDNEIEARKDREHPAMKDIIDSLPKKGEVWKHTKTGGHYEVTGSIFNTITDRVDVKYKPLYPCEWPEFSRQMTGNPKSWMTPNENGSLRFEKVGMVDDAAKHPEWFDAP